MLLATTAGAPLAAGEARAQEPEPFPGCPVAPVAPEPPPEPANEAESALVRGNELERRGESEAALEAYRESARRADGLGEPRLAALARANAARAAVAAGRLQPVPQELAAVVAALDDFAPGPTRTQLLIHVARTWIRLGQSGASAGAPERAAGLLRRAAEEAEATGDARQQSFALGYLGELEASRGRPGEALALSRRAIQVGHRADAPDALYRWYWQAGRLERAAGRSAQALSDYRTAATAISQLRRDLALSPVDFRDVLGSDQNDLYLELVDLLLRASRAERDVARRQELLAEARNTLELQKNDELRDYYQDECLAVFQATAPDSIPGAVIAYPIPLPDRLETIVSGPAGLQSLVARVDRETLSAEVAALRRQLANRTSLDYERHAETLYDWVIRPLEPVLTEARPETLVFVPGPPLRTIPMGALRDRASGRFLVEKVSLAVIPSLTLTDPRPIPRGDVRMLAVGLSESVSGYAALGNVSREIEAVEAAFPSRTLMNDDFSAKRFEREIRSRPFGIVHIASHGEFADDPSESFLLTHDGKLSMDRLAQAVSTTQFRQDQPLELLTLSACETAAGNDRAALGLAGIAVRSGARSALATLWAVEDRAAAELVIAFYEKLRDDQVSRARALQLAQLAMLEMPVFKHPGYWSPFILINSWL